MKPHLSLQAVGWSFLAAAVTLTTPVRAQVAVKPAPKAAAPAVAVHERKNIDAITPGISSADGTELKAYEHAIDLLQRSNDASNNYQFWADLHDVFGPNHGCEHRNELFFPWHRSLLYSFELRSAPPTRWAHPARVPRT